MGKPFATELSVLSSTFKWARTVDVRAVAASLSTLASGPLLTIGSGGSLSSACLASETLSNTRGVLGKFETPFLGTALLRQGYSDGVLLLSAGGENPDVLGICKQAVASEVSSLVSICCREGSSLSQIVGRYGRGQAFEFPVPSGSDGFLATNTLVALNTILVRACGHEDELPNSWPELALSSSLLQTTSGACPDEVIVLFGPDTRAAAVDLESKFSEAALSTVQLVDIRNFAHGRHNWIAKRPDTVIVSLVSRLDSDLLEKTLGALPPATKKITFTARSNGLAASFEMQAIVFELTRLFGLERGTDPGRPGIPAFGRRIYHLNAYPGSKKQSICQAAMQRKVIARDQAGYDPLSAKQWQQYCSENIEVLRAARFRQAVFDYDGTLCDHRDRYEGLRRDVSAELVRLLNADIHIGIATGRGKSVREALRQRVPDHLWNKVFVGYYNGTVCLALDSAVEVGSASAELPELKLAYEELMDAKLPNVQITLRPTQITVEPLQARPSIDVLWRSLTEMLDAKSIRGLKILSSSRSIDIVTDVSSKLNILNFMPAKPTSGDTLFLGDRPRWPGNDHEMLTQQFSLSVDEVAPSLERGWNFAPAGVLNADATLFYLQRCKPTRGTFRLALEVAK